MVIKKYGPFLLLAFLSLRTTYGQAIQITPSCGYHFGTKLNYGQNYLKMDDSEQYGLTVGYDVDGELMVEATWIHQDSELLASAKPLR